MSAIVGQRRVLNSLPWKLPHITSHHLNYSTLSRRVCRAEFGLFGSRLLAPIRGHPLLLSLATIDEDSDNRFTVHDVVPMDTHEQKITVWHVFYRPMLVHSSAV